MRRFMGVINMCNMVQVSHPSIRPVNGKLRLSVGLIILPSVPDRREFSFALFSTPLCVFCLVVVFLPQVRAVFVTPCTNHRRTEVGVI